MMTFRSEQGLPNIRINPMVGPVTAPADGANAAPVSSAGYAVR